MSIQTELWESLPAKPANQRLFIGILPDRLTAQRIHTLAAETRTQHRLSGALRPLSHLHITLRWINDYPEIPQGHVLDLKTACETVAASSAPFLVQMGRVLSWGNGVGKHPVVLTGQGDSNDPLLWFQNALWKQLILSGHPGKGGREFNPHITLLYDDLAIPGEAVAPIAWEVRDFVLIHSEVGSTKYHELGRWALRG